MIQQMQTHPFPPVYNESSRILILGSFPSTASREAGFYYAHPRNRFWQVIAAVTGEGVPQTIEQKTALLLPQTISRGSLQKHKSNASSATARQLTPAMLKPAFQTICPLQNRCHQPAPLTPLGALKGSLRLGE